jgi:hypothetical protein
MLLRVITVCPGTDWVPGQTVDATAEQANEWADGVHAVVVRSLPVENAADTEREER